MREKWKARAQEAERENAILRAEIAKLEKLVRESVEMRCAIHRLRGLLYDAVIETNV